MKTESPGNRHGGLSGAGRGLKGRLLRAFMLQAAFISVAAVLGVYLAGTLLEQSLIREALESEAEYFWNQRQQAASFPLPDTLNLNAYLARPGVESDLPEFLRGLEPGYHRVQAPAPLALVYVEDRDDQRLYLLFEGERVARLAMYFGLVPLAGVLVLLYVSIWLGYLSSRRAISPVVALAREVNHLAPDETDRGTLLSARLPSDADDEVRVLAAAMDDYIQRLNAFVDRERNFTRDASHELRSPLTVIRMAADMLTAEHRLDEAASREVQRIRRSARDMEELVEAFLLLARDSERKLESGSVCVNSVAAEEIRRSRPLVEGRNVTLELHQSCRVLIPGSAKVLSVLIGNLLRNACSYTDAGRVQVRVDAGGLEIEDSGIGMAQETVQHAFDPFFRANPSRRGGHGVGLTIVKRLSDRFGWPVRIDSQPGSGTRVSVQFPQARVEPLPDSPSA